MVADSDDLILLLIDGGELQSQLEIGRRGLKSGALEVGAPALTRKIRRGRPQSIRHARDLRRGVLSGP